MSFDDGGMSMAEYEYQYGLCNDGPDDECSQPPALEMPAGFWRTRDNVTLKIRDMTEDHIRNTIRLFEDAGWGASGKIEELRAELSRREGG